MGGRAFQFIEMNGRCAILSHLLVPVGTPNFRQSEFVGETLQLALLEA
jgi:hypothetical protein